MGKTVLEELDCNFFKVLIFYILAIKIDCWS